MGAFEVPAGMYRVQGKVTINGEIAREGDVVEVGDIVETGPHALAVFIVGRDVFLVRANSRLELDPALEDSFKADVAEVLRVVKGQVLAVFGRGAKEIQLPTATVGVRGTGVYVEADSVKSYYCTCYGTAEITATADPAVSLSVQTQYHEAPVYIYRSPSDSAEGNLIEPAPVINHSDDELIMLEAIVFRKPPFLDEENPDTGGY
jgi:hypothetical protein